MQEADDHIDEVISDLEARLARYPEERYPVQHATVCFHLGVALTNAGRIERAERLLETAVRLFDPERLATENAKATNALGAALRLGGRVREAREAFERAAAAFSEADAPAERGAALFNLGLALRDEGELERAAGAFDEARDLFASRRAGEQSAAAARELGGTLLMMGDLDRAAATLEEARAMADRVGDQAGLGAAANALGLARLGAADHDAAIAAFRAAAGAHPRAVRPDDHAMAKANLALAHERAGQAAPARLNARQALAVRGAPDPVREQVAAVLDRLGDAGPGELLAVLDDVPDPDRRAALVREEVMRWLDLPEEARRAEAGAWIDGQLARPKRSMELAEAWVGALLELPQDALETMIESTLRPLAERDAEAQERFRTEASMAMARFHVPQLMRLRGEFNRIAERLGEEPAWA